jgi:hypothetical protein
MVRLNEGFNVRNHRIHFALALIVGLGGLVRCARGGGPQASRDLKSLKVLYVGDPDDERGRAVTGFLRQHVARVDEAARRSFDPASADSFDVIVLDWPQGGKFPPDACPLGAREKWGRPTVLLGSAGLNLAVAWKLKGGAGCTCMEPVAYGLRAHEIFDAPFGIDREPLVVIKTPLDFMAEVSTQRIRVLPLVDDPELNWRPGWCTYDYDFAQAALAPDVWNHIKDKSRQEMITWAEAESQWLHPNADCLLEIDSDLKTIGVTFDDPTFPDTVVHLLGGTPEQRARGRLLASRYLPDLGKTGTAVPEGESATAWLTENHAYLFASDTGDYRWYIDPLAKKRHIPWRELLGSRRADLADQAFAVCSKPASPRTVHHDSSPSPQSNWSRSVRE